MSVFGRNQEGYPDPTAAEAIAKASKKKYLPLVYICSKYSGDVVTNTETAKRYSRFAVDQDAIPLAPHLLLPLYMGQTENGTVLSEEIIVSIAILVAEEIIMIT